MKGLKYFRVISVGGLICISVAVYSQKMVRNPHKFTKESWEVNEPCNPCHVYSSDEKSGKRFIISYENDTIVSPDSIYVSGVSKLCISCHDGIVAGFDHRVDIWHILDGRSRYSHNHPVSVEYRAKNKGRYRLHDPDTTSSGLGGTIAEDLLVNGRVECVSCHNAHFSMEKVACSTCPKVDNINLDENYLSLWKSNRQSLLCLTCHNF